MPKRKESLCTDRCSSLSVRGRGCATACQGRLQPRTVPEQQIPEAERERAGRAGAGRAGSRRAGTGSWNWFLPGQTGNDGRAWCGGEAAAGLGQSRARCPHPTVREGAHGAQHHAACPRPPHPARTLETHAFCKPFVTYFEPRIAV